MVALSPLAGAGWQFFDNNGVPLAGGKLYTYAAGTTTPSTTYTSSSGATPHANPIILDSAGRVPSEVWLTSPASYKFVLKTSVDVEIWTKDNIEGIFVASALLPATNVTFTGFKSQTGNVQDLADNDGSDWIGFLQDGTGAVAVSAQDKMRESLSVLDFGADNTGTTDSTAAIQAALDAAAVDPLAIKSVFIPAGIYKVGRLVLPVGSHVYGEGGKSVSTGWSNTRLVQNANDDMFIFGSFQGGSLFYWFGQVSDIQIVGSNTYPKGFAFRTVDLAGNNVNLQDQTLFENMTIRAMPEGGMHFTTGAFPATLRNVEFLWNGGPGITLTRVTVYNGLHLDNISADGNVGGAVKMVSWSTTDNVLITNLKSEARVNTVYGGGVGQQLVPIVVDNCNNCAITIVGANHISSIPDGGFFKKPGNLVQLTGPNYPQITWNGVIIRVRATDTGTDPYVIGGFLLGVSPPPYQPLYTVQNGTFGTDFPFYNSRMLLFRSTAGSSATPSAANLNVLTMSYAGATTITNFTDGEDGQILLLLFTTANATIQNNANIVLATGASWTPPANATLTLAYLGGKWRELSRGYGSNLGSYTITNVITDRTYDANATTLDEIADVLGTLISDLTTRGVI